MEHGPPRLVVNLGEGARVLDHPTDRRRQLCGESRSRGRPIRGVPRVSVKNVGLRGWLKDERQQELSAELALDLAPWDG